MRQTPEEFAISVAKAVLADYYEFYLTEETKADVARILQADRKQAQADILREVLKLTLYPVQVGDEDRVDLIHPGDVLELAKARGLDLEGEDDV